MPPLQSGRAADGALAVDPSEVDQLAILGWGRVYGNHEDQAGDVPLFAEAWCRYKEQAVDMPE
eukprot:2741540-Alexandrium_andersonii.AAC.1